MWIGILMLMGIVTKNAIMLVEFAVEAIREGMPRDAAIIDAGMKRARPIVMTTIAMAAGMVPSALAFGAGGEFRSPMALAVIGGLIFSTVLSLIFVPAMFMLMDDRRQSVVEVRQEAAGQQSGGRGSRPPIASRRITPPTRRANKGINDARRSGLCLARAALLRPASRSPLYAADEPNAPRGAAVTVLKVAKSCFSATVEIAGLLMPREEIAVRPDRPGLKIADVLVEAGENVNAGQTMARLALPDGGTSQVQAPVTGLVSNSTAVIGGQASAKGEVLFSIIARSEFDLIGAGADARPVEAQGRSSRADQNAGRR